MSNPRAKHKALTVRIPTPLYDDASDLATLLKRPLREFVQQAIEARVKDIVDDDTDEFLKTLRDRRSALRKRARAKGIL